MAIADAHNLNVDDAVSDEDALKAFLLDIDCLEPLRAWTRHLNVFDILKIARTEIRHSNMLAWLMDPRENHGLDDRVLRGIVQFVAQALNGDDVFKDLLVDTERFSIMREWRGIDILAVSDADRYVLCIENKVGSGEHDNQLDRYRRIIADTYPGFRARFVYLTPDCAEASDPEHWIPMGYADMLEIIETAQTAGNPSPEADLLIRSYIETVRRSVLDDVELERTCAAIYAKHKQALDLLFEHRPDKMSEVSDACKRWAERMTALGTITIDAERCNKRFTRFMTGTMSGILPDTARPSSDWGTRNHYFYEIVVDDDGDRVHLQLALNSHGLDESGLDICDRINQIQKAKVQKKAWRWRTQWKSGSVSVPDDFDEQELEKKLDGLLKQAQAIEKKIAKGMAEFE